MFLSLFLFYDLSQLIFASQHVVGRVQTQKEKKEQVLGQATGHVLIDGALLWNMSFFPKRYI